MQTPSLTHYEKQFSMEALLSRGRTRQQVDAHTQLHFKSRLELFVILPAMEKFSELHSYNLCQRAGFCFLQRDDTWSQFHAEVLLCVTWITQE